MTEQDILNRTEWFARFEPFELFKIDPFVSAQQYPDGPVQYFQKAVFEIKQALRFKYENGFNPWFNSWYNRTNLGLFRAPEEFALCLYQDYLIDKEINPQIGDEHHFELLDEILLSYFQIKLLSDQFEFEDKKLNRLPSRYNPEQLGIIFERLAGKELVDTKEKQVFINVFTCGTSGKVHWGASKRRAKVALFNLFYEITGEILKTKTVKQFIYCPGMHDKWMTGWNTRDGIGSRSSILDSVFKDL